MGLMIQPRLHAIFRYAIDLFNGDLFGDIAICVIGGR